jgi:RNA polymerase sigma-54 factor
MLKQQLGQKQQQRLSPLQIQQAKLLELTALEMEDRVKQELEDNPALEEEAKEQAEETNSAEDISLGDYRTEDDIPDYKIREHYTREASREGIPYSEEETFRENLLGQLRLKSISPKELRVGEYLIGNLDEAGYLRREPEAISDDLAFQYNMEVSTNEINHVLSIIQELDPAGVGARNLQECLSLQLERKDSSPEIELSRKIISNYFDVFSRKQYDKIMKSLRIDEDQLKMAIKEITSLNPHPGASWESDLESKSSQIIPDFRIDTIDGELYFSLLDSHIPVVKVNKEYVDMLNAQSRGGNKASDKEAALYLKHKVDSANWFVEAINQRNETLRKTMLTIMDIQREFFLTGDETKLKPMILKNVAERNGYDISTISRVSNSKYVQTNWGIYPLKYFFSEKSTNEEGEEVSTREIKVILKELIENEDKKAPYTDESLQKELKKKGYEIARRTVAKYREQLNIPVARLRKTF